MSMFELPIYRHADETANFARAIEHSNVRVIARFTVDGEPISKARARFTNYRSPGRMYTPQKTRQGEERVAWLFRQAAPHHKPDPDCEYGLACVFFAATRQRRDVDNMIKLISDALNGVAWDDDVQVSEVMGRRGHDLPENARTEVLVYQLGERQFPTARCEQCGQDFRTYQSWSKKKYCSQECRSDALREHRRATCVRCGDSFYLAHKGHPQETCSPECRSSLDRVSLSCSQCGKPFNLPKSRAPQRKAPALCSHECRLAYWAERRTANPKGSCTDCWGPVSRKEYARCRACATEHRGASKRTLINFEELS